MKFQIATLATLLVFGPSFGAAHAQAPAQSADAAYCKRWRAVRPSTTTTRTSRRAPTSANVAITKCGETRRRHPVLEGAKDAGVPLPSAETRRLNENGRRVADPPPVSFDVTHPG